MVIKVIFWIKNFDIFGVLMFFISVCNYEFFIKGFICIWFFLYWLYVYNLFELLLFELIVILFKIFVVCVGVWLFIVMEGVFFCEILLLINFMLNNVIFDENVWNDLYL